MGKPGPPLIDLAIDLHGAVGRLWGAAGRSVKGLCLISTKKNLKLPKPQNPKTYNPKTETTKALNLKS